GTMPVDLPQVAALRAASALDSDAVTPGDQLAQTGANLWTAKVRFGMGGSTGNSESRTWLLGAKARREQENDRLYLRLLANKAAQDGEETTDDIIGSLRMEHDFSENFFV